MATWGHPSSPLRDSLNDHQILFPCSYSFNELHLEIVQHVKTNTWKPQPENMQRARPWNTHSYKNWVHQIPPPASASGSLYMKRQKGFLSWRAWRTTHKCSRPEIQLRTETEAAFTGPAWVCARWGPRTLRRSANLPRSLVQKLSPIDNHLQIKVYFLPREPHWRNKLPLRVGPVPSNRWRTQNKLNLFGGALSDNAESELFKNCMFF